MSAVAARWSSFMDAARQPAILHPGHQPILLAEGCFQTRLRSDGLLIEAWDEHRTIARRVVAVESESRGRLILRFEKFGGGSGLLELVDLALPKAAPALRRARRHVLREQLRRWLGRQFPSWRVEELTDGADLENSLSPVFSRAVIRRGTSRLAVLASPSEREHADRAATFGLIWLDYLRRREKAPVEGLVLFLPASGIAATRLRAQFLNVRMELFAYDEDGHESAADTSDCGNLIQALPPAAMLDPGRMLDGWGERALKRGDVAASRSGDALSLRMLGLEFARLVDGEWWATLDGMRRLKSEDELCEAAESVAAVRKANTAERNHPWYRRQPEAWLEQMVRRNPEAVDARLRPSPVYSQMMEWAACDRGVMDLVALDVSGRLAVLELKASEDPHLPIQALDYWIQARHHAIWGEFTKGGYFPGLTIRKEAPRILLVAPSLSFHPTTEKVLRFFPKDIEVTRVGLAVEWQYGLRVAVRASGAQRPDRHFLRHHAENNAQPSATGVEPVEPG